MVNSGARLSTHGLLYVFVIVLWILLAFFAACAIYYICLVLLRLLDRRRDLHSPHVFLELTPPSFSAKTPLATAQLFSILHELALPHSVKDRVLGHRSTLSLEIVSSRSRGIRYVLYLPLAQVTSVQRDIASYLPGVRFKKIKNYSRPDSSKTTSQVIEFNQTGSASLPLAPHNDLDQHDPVAYMVGAMTQLGPKEQIIFQLVTSPMSDSASHRHMRGASYARTSRQSSKTWHVIYRTLRIVMGILIRIVDAFQIMVLDMQKTHRQFNSPSHSSYLAETSHLDAIHEKLSQPIFQVSVRAYIVASSKARAQQRCYALESSLATFDFPDLQSLRVKHRGLFGMSDRFRSANFHGRTLSLLSSCNCLMSASELAAMYHFPFSTTSKTENLATSLSRSLPAPASLKGNKKYDVLLGSNVHQGTTTPIGLTEAERERHVYIVGGTGNGKTTMLLYGIEQDIRHGKGLAVIDPHGDLAETILQYIPKNRLKDVIYFNPDDVNYPLGMNLLEIPDGLTGNDLVREKDLITETVVSVFRKIFSGDDSGGHRIEYVLRNTIQTALTTENATIFTVFRILTNNAYRKNIVSQLTDTDLQDFWNNEMGKAGEYQRIKMSAGITAKVGRFLFSGSAKRVLAQPKSTIDFDDIINSGKILICNFSKGLLGEDTAALFGITVLAKLQIATLRRARLQPEERRPFYLYVDEFQNFATMSFVQLLSEARKYKLFLNMAEQSTSQQSEPRIANIILANVGTIVCFRSANPADEQLILPIFAPFITPGEIAYLPPYHFFIRIAASRSEEPFSGETVVLTNPHQLRAEQVIEASRFRYAIAEETSNEQQLDADDYEIDYPLAMP